MRLWTKQNSKLPGWPPPLTSPQGLHSRRFGSLCLSLGFGCPRSRHRSRPVRGSNVGPCWGWLPEAGGREIPSSLFSSATLFTVPILQLLHPQPLVLLGRWHGSRSDFTGQGRFDARNKQPDGAGYILCHAESHRTPAALEWDVPSVYGLLSGTRLWPERRTPLCGVGSVSTLCGQIVVWGFGGRLDQMKEQKGS